MNPTNNPTQPTTTVTTSITTPRVTAAASRPTGGPQGGTTEGQGMSGAQGGATRMPAMYSLGMIAATLDNFSGKDVVRYVQKFEQRAELDGWTEQETLKLFKFKCVGEACDYLSSDPTLTGLTFEGLKARLIARFHASALPGESQMNLSKCYQRHDESVSAYCTRLRICSAKVLQEDLRNALPVEEPGLRRKSQDSALNQFKIGLRREIMKDVGILLLREDDLTLEKAERLVSLHETTLKMIQGKNSGHQVMALRCYTCGEDGHLSRDCGQANNTRRTGNTCFTCGRSGHWARDCLEGSRNSQRDVNMTRDQRGLRAVRQEGQRGNRGGFGRGDRPQEVRTHGQQGWGNRRTQDYGGRGGPFPNTSRNFSDQSYGASGGRQRVDRNTGAIPRVRWQDSHRDIPARNNGTDEGVQGPASLN